MPETVTIADRKILATRLLNAARDQAIPVTHDGKPVSASAANLRDYAAAVRGVILQQAESGMWAPVGAARGADLMGLDVQALLGNTLIGQPPIRLVFDFAATAIPEFTVDSVKASSLT